MDEGGSWTDGRPPIRIGTRMLLNIEAGRHRGVFPTYVEDLTDKAVWVAMPIWRGRLVVPDRGETISVEQPDTMGVYRWETSVHDQRLTGVPVLALDYPVRFWRGQRRLFFRLEITLPVAFVVMDEAGRAHGAGIPGLGVAYTPAGRRLTGTTGNLSGGGLLLQTDYPLLPRNRLDLEMALPSGKHVHATGEVVRVVRPLHRRPGQYGVHFVQIALQDLEAIVRLIWTEQQARRRAGLL